MATQEIPVQFENPNYEQRTRLSGKDFLLRFRYQERDCFWYLRISDTNGNVIVGDTRIIANLPLLSTVTDLGRPAWEIICIDLPSVGQTEQTARDPHFSDLGRRHKMFYQPFEDML